MTDLTSTLSTILIEKHSSKPIPSKPAQLNHELDAFVSEAYQINHSINSLLTYLRAIRQPYLSTGPPPRRTATQQRNKGVLSGSQYVPGFGEIPSHLTDPQREDIDAQTAILLRDINGNITNLSSAAKLQHDTAVKVLEKKYGKPSGFLWRWAAGDGDGNEDDMSGKSEEQVQDEGQEKTVHGYREGVIWYLQRGLKDAVGVQSGMVEIRIEREREKRSSVLYDERNKNVTMEKRATEQENDMYGNVDLRGRDRYNPALDASTNTTNAMNFDNLSPEQLQLFESENSSLLNHYTDTLSKVTQAEKSLMEISSLQQTLVGHLNVQGEMIGQLVEDAGTTETNLKRGNKELKKASERGSTARGVFFGTIGLCSFLIVWDLIF